MMLILLTVYKQYTYLIENVQFRGVFKTSKLWFNKMYYSDQGPHIRGLGGRVS